MCTEQDQSPYSAIVEPCPAIPPAGLSIKVETSKEEDTDVILPEQELTFVLTQESVCSLDSLAQCNVHFAYDL